MNVTIINITVIAIIIYCIGSGYKHGFLWKLVNIIGFFLVGFLSWWLSSPVGNMISLYPKDQVPLQGTILEGVFYNNLNRILIFIVLFIVFQVALLIIKPVVKIISKLPVISIVNKLLGALLGGVQAFLYMMLMSLVLQLPFFENGEQLVASSNLRYCEPIMNTVLEQIKEPLGWLETVAGDIEDTKPLTKQEQIEFRQWLLKQGIEEEKVEAFLNTLRSE